MAFFKKLKERLFKSSSKIKEGLDAIVEEGGVEEELVVDTAAQEAEAERVEAERVAAEQAEAARIEAERVEAERLEAVRVEAERIEAERLEAEQVERARLGAERAAAQAAEEAARDAAEAEAEAARIKQEELAAATALAEQQAAEAAAAAAAAEEADRAAQEAAAAEAARLAQEAADRAASEAAAEAARQEADAARQAEADARAAQEAAGRAASEAAAEVARQEAEAARQADAAAAAAAAQAEAQAAAEVAQEPVAAVPLSERAPIAAALTEEPSEETAKKPGFFGRMLGRGEKKTVVRRALDDDMLESLEELLITADMGVHTALRVTANMAEGRFGKKLSVDEIKELLASEVTRIMEPVAKPMPLYAKKPQVVLVVGVNGSGKTTTIGKLASQFRAAGKSVVIAAGDTFRAAAVEQLQVWGDRAGVPVLTAPEGSDPASLAFDAMTQAEADGADLLMIDTAGRLQNRADLMEELAKIVRVIRKKDPEAPHNTLLVLDATTGQNALSQVKTFQELADVSGLVMTKLDGTAKGGVLVALADKFGLPIHAIGVGEQIDDLAPFDPEDFAAALTGLNR
ncbi:cell division protein FtsY [Thalassobium sp. R2A62]|nr:cell division protein FtsY [Thalassobium sp. R2A62]